VKVQRARRKIDLLGEESNVNTWGGKFNSQMHSALEQRLEKKVAEIRR
jgi:hypothetical protein